MKLKCLKKSRFLTFDKNLDSFYVFKFKNFEIFDIFEFRFFESSNVGIFNFLNFKFFNF